MAALKGTCHRTHRIRRKSLILLLFNEICRGLIKYALWWASPLVVYLASSDSQGWKDWVSILCQRLCCTVRYIIGNQPFLNFLSRLHSLLFGLAHIGLRPDMVPENELSSQRVHKNDMVDLRNRGSSAICLILHALLDFVLWLGISLLATYRTGRKMFHPTAEPRMADWVYTPFVAPALKESMNTPSPTFWVASVLCGQSRILYRHLTLVKTIKSLKKDFLLPQLNRCLLRLWRERCNVARFCAFTIFCLWPSNDPRTVQVFTKLTGSLRLLYNASGGGRTVASCLCMITTPSGQAPTTCLCHHQPERSKIL